ncbi:MAG TPA: sodium:calcium antiporter [Armatimonadota bacterium]
MKRTLALMLPAVALTLPGLYVRLAHVHLIAPQMALTAGAAILGASFLLLWACDAAQADMSQSLALALVALIAVLPEYAVDMYFTWQAGQHPEANYAHYAVANMTGANRLLIGVGWSVIVALYWLKLKKPVILERERRLELLFLAAATVYAFVIPIKGSLAWYDGVVFLSIYAGYIAVAGRRPTGECECEGPAALIVSLNTLPRRLATYGLFAFAGAVILANAGAFCEGLIGTGRAFHINEFLLVQWLAPIASEAPEFIVAIGFTLRGQAGMALGSLLSAKLNQWTLLVGMIPGVYAVSHGSLNHAIPMSSLQMHEVLLTAAQSLLGVVLIMTLRLSVWHAVLLFTLFIGQFLAPEILAMFPQALHQGLTGDRVHQVFSLLYVASSLSVLADSPSRLHSLWKGAWKPEEGDPPGPPLPTPDCAHCPKRLRLFG